MNELITGALFKRMVLHGAPHNTNKSFTSILLSKIKKQMKNHLLS